MRRTTALRRLREKRTWWRDVEIDAMSRTTRVAPCVLTIAGSDSGAGAGVQADARTIHALGGYALTAITAITAQNTRNVKAVQAIAPAIVAAQIEAVLEDFRVNAIKTGLLPSPAAIRAIARVLRTHSKIPLVLDPVLRSSSGTEFLSQAGVRVLKRELLPFASLVTPNWPEAEILTGVTIRDHAEAEAAGRKLLETGCAAVLVKGGHGPGRSCIDILVTQRGVTRFEGDRIQTRNTHGTGCVLSAAIATGLARGEPMEAAVEAARSFLRRQLERGRQRRLGQGAGPAFFGIESRRS